MVCGAQLSPREGADDYYHVKKNTSPQECHQGCQDDQKCATFMTWAFSDLQSDGHICYRFSKSPTDFRTEENVEKPFLIYDKNCAAPLQICGFPEVNGDNGHNDYYRVMRDTTPKACHEACKNDREHECASFVTFAASYLKSDGLVCYLYTRRAETFRVRNDRRDLFFVHDKECAAPA
ncbi:Apple-like protein [Metarhizium guizhouense ARSEF 977]|uniref:Apple-like protein n=1 Tax=Metarhizium guizhouense (strain ARSEF 977) TaxID=1276136 RepID=A0A0B4GVG0_METGA|nr:Apple-like protein [Metarhizium guizhouense ARSEF 977]